MSSKKKHLGKKNGSPFCFYLKKDIKKLSLGKQWRGEAASNGGEKKPRGGDRIEVQISSSGVVRGMEEWLMGCHGGVAMEVGGGAAKGLC